MSVAIAAADVVARNLGARAGLAAYRGVLGSVSTPHERARVLGSAFDCAHAVHDAEGIRWVTARWSELPRGDFFAQLAPRAVRLYAHDRAAARALAHAEVARAPEDARAHYLLARLDDEHAARSLRRALRLAERPPSDAALATSIRARLARAGESFEAIDVDALQERDRLAILVSRLRSSSRYRRVAALDALIELTHSSDSEVRAAAYALGARHADGALTSIERDRVETLIRTHPRAKAARVALVARQGLESSLPDDADEEAVAPFRRAVAVLERGTPGPAPNPPTDVWRALRAIAAIRRGAPAGDAFDALLDVAPHCVVTEPLLTAAWLGLGDPEIAMRAEQLAAILSGRPSHARHGYLRLSDAVGDPHVAERLLRCAAAAGEAGAEERLAERERAEAWAAFRRGDGERALPLLRAARARLIG